MVTELVQVLLHVSSRVTTTSTCALFILTLERLQIEQHLNTATIEELRAPRDEQLLQLFLAACKLLETLCTLPSVYVPLFQMCHWTFVPPLEPDSSQDEYLPIATRLDELLTRKVSERR